MLRLLSMQIQGNSNPDPPEEWSESAMIVEKGVFSSLSHSNLGKPTHPSHIPKGLKSKPPAKFRSKE